MIDFLTFGETLVQHNADYTGAYDPNGSYTRHVAGAESNVALDLRRLLPERVRAVWVSRLGADADGDMIRRYLEGKIDISAPHIPGQHTGIQLLNHMGGGEVVRRYRRAGSAASRLTARDILPHLDGSDLLHVTGITPALSDTCREATLETMKSAQQMNIPVSMDVNYRDALWRPEQARAVCDQMREYASVFKIGLDEAETIWGGGLSAEDFARGFWGGETRVAVVTVGDRGAVAYDGERITRHEGFRVEVIDPVGAGDAFVAGFLAGILESYTLRDALDLPASSLYGLLSYALELGNACGAVVCTRHGDTEPMPNMNQAREFVRAAG